MSRKYDLFVSHSQDDADRVRELTTAWTAAGVRIFVDYDVPSLVDASHRGTMSLDDIEGLREAAIQCHVFVFVASKRSVQSGWMPWELGLAHGAVGRVHICELDKGALDDFSEREYMRLYKGTVFSPANAISYVKKAVQQAESEPVSPARHAENVLMGQEYVDKVVKGMTLEAQQELIKRLAGHAEGTLEGGLGRVSESFSVTKRG